MLCLGRGVQTDFPAVLCIGSASSPFVCLSLSTPTLFVPLSYNPTFLYCPIPAFVFCFFCLNCDTSLFISHCLPLFLPPPPPLFFSLLIPFTLCHTTSHVSRQLVERKCWSLLFAVKYTNNDDPAVWCAGCLPPPRPLWEVSVALSDGERVYAHMGPHACVFH